MMYDVYRYYNTIGSPIMICLQYIILQCKILEKTVGPSNYLESYHLYINYQN